MSIDGDFAIVGAPSEDDALSCAFVFERDDHGLWQQVDRLAPSSSEAGGFFGKAVAISSNYAVVGAPGEAPTEWSSGSAGAAHVFERTDGGSWEPHTTIVWNRTYPRFGTSVGVSGNHVVVGAYSSADYELDFVDTHQAAYAFELDGAGSWSFAGTLFQQEGLAPSFRGFNGGVSIAGRHALVGWLLFERSTPTAWDQRDALAPAGAIHVGGIHISERAAIVSVARTGEDGSRSDGAFTYEPDPAGTWVPTGQLAPSDGSSISWGSSVSITDGYAIVGASIYKPVASVYLFARIGTAWQQQETFVLDGEGLGTKVDISGGSAIVTAGRTARILEEPCRDLPDGADCDDGQYCTGTETCQAGLCMSAGSPCEAGEVCTEDGCTAPLESAVGGGCAIARRRSPRPSTHLGMYM